MRSKQEELVDMATRKTTASAVEKFQKAHPTRASKEKALRGMTNAQIDKLIKSTSNVQAKNFYASFKKK